jgi:hypothetical protein
MINYDGDPIALDALYVVTWYDAHGEVHETFRRGVDATTFAAALFAAPGCRLMAMSLMVVQLD